MDHRALLQRLFTQPISDLVIAAGKPERDVAVYAFRGLVDEVQTLRTYPIKACRVEILHISADTRFKLASLVVIR